MGCPHLKFGSPSPPSVSARGIVYSLLCADKSVALIMLDCGCRPVYLFWTELYRAYPHPHYNMQRNNANSGLT